MLILKTLVSFSLYVIAAFSNRSVSLAVMVVTSVPFGTFSVTEASKMLCVNVGSLSLTSIMFMRTLAVAFLGGTPSSVATIVILYMLVVSLSSSPFTESSPLALMAKGTATDD